MDSKVITISYNYDLRSDSKLPLVRLTGNWLEQLGFSIGKKFSVERSQGKLTLKLIED